MRSILKKYPFLILLMLGLCGSVFAQSPVTAKVDSAAMPIGQQTTLRFFVYAQAKQPVVFPAIKDSITSKLEIIGAPHTDTVPDQDHPGMQTIRRSYVITAFDPGTYTVPAFTFKIGNDSVQTQPFSFQVTSVKVDTTKAIYDIKQPMAVSYTFLDWLRDNAIGVGLGLLLAAIIAAVIIYLKKQQKPQPQPEVVAKPNVPVHVIALNRLNELRDKKLWQMDFFKEYHSELTDILRDYIEARYNVKAHEKTTDEILSGLRYNVDQTEWTRLQQIFVLADLVKFAKEKPIAADNEQSLENAVAFVRATQHVPAPAKEGGADGLA